MDAIRVWGASDAAVADAAPVPKRLGRRGGFGRGLNGKEGIRRQGFQGQIRIAFPLDDHPPLPNDEPPFGTGTALEFQPLGRASSGSHEEAVRARSPNDGAKSMLLPVAALSGALGAGRPPTVALDVPSHHEQFTPVSPFDSRKLQIQLLPIFQSPDDQRVLQAEHLPVFVHGVHRIGHRVEWKRSNPNLLRASLAGAAHPDHQQEQEGGELQSGWR